MSSIPSISHPPVPPTLAANASTPARGSDGDSTAQEAAESSATRVAEAHNGGSARSKNIVNKTA